jgi:hypothetical protein
MLRSIAFPSVPNHLVRSAALGCVLVASRLIEPSALPEMCLFKMITGIPCMFCGLTHSFHAISLGHFREAIAYHPLGLLAYGLVVFHFLTGCLRLSGRQFPKLMPQFDVSTMMKSTFVLFALVWIWNRLAALM